MFKFRGNKSKGTFDDQSNTNFVHKQRNRQRESLSKDEKLKFYNNIK